MPRTELKRLPSKAEQDAILLKEIKARDAEAIRIRRDKNNAALRAVMSPAQRDADTALTEKNRREDLGFKSKEEEEQSKRKELQKLAEERGPVPMSGIEARKNNLNPGNVLIDEKTGRQALSIAEERKRLKKVGDADYSNIDAAQGATQAALQTYTTGSDLLTGRDDTRSLKDAEGLNAPWVTAKLNDLQLMDQEHKQAGLKKGALYYHDLKRRRDELAKADNFAASKGVPRHAEEIARMNAELGGKEQGALDYAKWSINNPDLLGYQIGSEVIEEGMGFAVGAGVGKGLGVGLKVIGKLAAPLAADSALVAAKTAQIAAKTETLVGSHLGDTAEAIAGGIGSYDDVKATLREQNAVARREGRPELFTESEIEARALAAGGTTAATEQVLDSVVGGRFERRMNKAITGGSDAAVDIAKKAPGAIARVAQDVGQEVATGVAAQAVTNTVTNVAANRDWATGLDRSLIDEALVSAGTTGALSGTREAIGSGVAAMQSYNDTFGSKADPIQTASLANAAAQGARQAQAVSGGETPDGEVTIQKQLLAAKPSEDLAIVEKALRDKGSSEESIKSFRDVYTKTAGGSIQLKGPLTDKTLGLIFPDPETREAFKQRQLNPVTKSSYLNATVPVENLIKSDLIKTTDDTGKTDKGISKVLEELHSVVDLSTNDPSVSSSMLSPEAQAVVKLQENSNAVLRASRETGSSLASKTLQTPGSEQSAVWNIGKSIQEAKTPADKIKALNKAEGFLERMAESMPAPEVKALSDSIKNFKGVVEERELPAGSGYKPLKTSYDEERTSRTQEAQEAAKALVPSDTTKPTIEVDESKTVPIDQKKRGTLSLTGRRNERLAKEVKAREKTNKEKFDKLKPIVKEKAGLTKEARASGDIVVSKLKDKLIGRIQEISKAGKKLSTVNHSDVINKVFSDSVIGIYDPGLDTAGFVSSQGSIDKNIVINFAPEDTNYSETFIHELVHFSEADTANGNMNSLIQDYIKTGGEEAKRIEAAATQYKEVYGDNDQREFVAEFVALLFSSDDTSEASTNARAAALNIVFNEIAKRQPNETVPNSLSSIIPINTEEAEQVDFLANAISAIYNSAVGLWSLNAAGISIEQFADSVSEFVNQAASIPKKAKSLFPEKNTGEDPVAQAKLSTLSSYQDALESHYTAYAALLRVRTEFLNNEALLAHNKKLQDAYVRVAAGLNSVRSLIQTEAVDRISKDKALSIFDDKFSSIPGAKDQLSDSDKVTIMAAAMTQDSVDPLPTVYTMLHAAGIDIPDKTIQELLDQIVYSVLNDFRNATINTEYSKVMLQDTMNKFMDVNTIAHAMIEIEGMPKDALQRLKQLLISNTDPFASNSYLIAAAQMMIDGAIKGIRVDEAGNLKNETKKLIKTPLFVSVENSEPMSVASRDIALANSEGLLTKEDLDAALSKAPSITLKRATNLLAERAMAYPAREVNTTPKYFAVVDFETTTDKGQLSKYVTTNDSDAYKEYLQQSDIIAMSITYVSIDDPSAPTITKTFNSKQKDEMATAIQNAALDEILVAHNAGFELAVLLNKFGWGGSSLVPTYGFIDTVDLVSTARPGTGKSLDAALINFNVKEDDGTQTTKQSEGNVETFIGMTLEQIEAKEGLLENITSYAEQDTKATSKLFLAAAQAAMAGTTVNKNAGLKTIGAASTKSVNRAVTTVGTAMQHILSLTVSPRTGLLQAGPQQRTTSDVVTERLKKPIYDALGYSPESITRANKIVSLFITATAVFSGKVSKNLNEDESKLIYKQVKNAVGDKAFKVMVLQAEQVLALRAKEHYQNTNSNMSTDLSTINIFDLMSSLDTSKAFYSRVMMGELASVETMVDLPGLVVGLRNMQSKRDAVFYSEEERALPIVLHNSKFLSLNLVDLGIQQGGNEKTNVRAKLEMLKEGVVNIGLIKILFPRESGSTKLVTLGSDDILGTLSPSEKRSFINDTANAAARTRDNLVVTALYRMHRQAMSELRFAVTAGKIKEDSKLTYAEFSEKYIEALLTAQGIDFSPIKDSIRDIFSKINGGATFGVGANIWGVAPSPLTEKELFYLHDQLGDSSKASSVANGMANLAAKVVAGEKIKLLGKWRESERNKIVRDISIEVDGTSIDFNLGALDYASILAEKLIATTDRELSEEELDAFLLANNQKDPKKLFNGLSRELWLNLLNAHALEVRYNDPELSDDKKLDMSAYLLNTSLPPEDIESSITDEDLDVLLKTNLDASDLSSMTQKELRSVVRIKVDGISYLVTSTNIARVGQAIKQHKAASDITVEDQAADEEASQDRDPIAQSDERLDEIFINENSKDKDGANLETSQDSLLRINKDDTAEWIDDFEYGFGLLQKREDLSVDPLISSTTVVLPFADRKSRGKYINVLASVADKREKTSDDLVREFGKTVHYFKNRATPEIVKEWIKKYSDVGVTLFNDIKALEKHAGAVASAWTSGLTRLSTAEREAVTESLKKELLDRVDTTGKVTIYNQSSLDRAENIVKDLNSDITDKANRTTSQTPYSRIKDKLTDIINSIREDYPETLREDEFTSTTILASKDMADTLGSDAFGSRSIILEGNLARALKADVSPGRLDDLLTEARTASVRPTVRLAGESIFNDKKPKFDLKLELEEKKNKIKLPLTLSAIPESGDVVKILDSLVVDNGVNYRSPLDDEEAVTAREELVTLLAKQGIGVSTQSGRENSPELNRMGRLLTQAGIINDRGAFVRNKAYKRFLLTGTLQLGRDSDQKELIQSTVFTSPTGQQFDVTLYAPHTMRNNKDRIVEAILDREPERNVSTTIYDTMYPALVAAASAVEEAEFLKEEEFTGPIVINMATQKIMGLSVSGLRAQSLDGVDDTASWLLGQALDGGLGGFVDRTQPGVIVIDPRIFEDEGLTVREQELVNRVVRARRASRYSGVRDQFDDVVAALVSPQSYLARVNLANELLGGEEAVIGASATRYGAIQSYIQASANTLSIRPRILPKKADEPVVNNTAPKVAGFLAGLFGLRLGNKYDEALRQLSRTSIRAKSALEARRNQVAIALNSFKDPMERETYDRIIRESFGDVINRVTYIGGALPLIKALKEEVRTKGIVDPELLRTYDNYVDAMYIWSVKQALSSPSRPLGALSTQIPANIADMEDKEFFKEDYTGFLTMSAREELLENVFGAMATSFVSENERGGAWIDAVLRSLSPSKHSSPIVDMHVAQARDFLRDIMYTTKYPEKTNTAFYKMLMANHYLNSTDPEVIDRHLDSVLGTLIRKGVSRGEVIKAVKENKALWGPLGGLLGDGVTFVGTTDAQISALMQTGNRTDRLEAAANTGWIVPFDGKIYDSEKMSVIPEWGGRYSGWMVSNVMRSAVILDGKHEVSELWKNMDLIRQWKHWSTISQVKALASVQVAFSAAMAVGGMATLASWLTVRANIGALARGKNLKDSAILGAMGFRAQWELMGWNKGRGRNSVLEEDSTVTFYSNLLLQTGFMDFTSDSGVELITKHKAVMDAIDNIVKTGDITSNVGKIIRYIMTQGTHNKWVNIRDGIGLITGLFGYIDQGARATMFVDEYQRYSDLLGTDPLTYNEKAFTLAVAATNTFFPSNPRGVVMNMANNSLVGFLNFMTKTFSNLISGPYRTYKRDKEAGIKPAPLYTHLVASYTRQLALLVGVWPYVIKPLLEFAAKTGDPCLDAANLVLEAHDVEGRIGSAVDGGATLVSTSILNSFHNGTAQLSDLATKAWNNTGITNDNEEKADLTADALIAGADIINSMLIPGVVASPIKTGDRLLNRIDSYKRALTGSGSSSIASLGAGSKVIDLDDKDSKYDSPFMVKGHKMPPGLAKFKILGIGPELDPFGSEKGEPGIKTFGGADESGKAAKGAFSEYQKDHQLYVLKMVSDLEDAYKAGELTTDGKTDPKKVTSVMNALPSVDSLLKANREAISLKNDMKALSGCAPEGSDQKKLIDGLIKMYEGEIMKADYVMGKAAAQTLPLIDMDKDTTKAVQSILTMWGGSLHHNSKRGAKIKPVPIAMVSGKSIRANYSKKPFNVLELGNDSHEAYKKATKSSWSSFKKTSIEVDDISTKAMSRTRTYFTDADTIQTETQYFNRETKKLIKKVVKGHRLAGVASDEVELSKPTGEGKAFKASIRADIERVYGKNTYVVDMLVKTDTALYNAKTKEKLTGTTAGHKRGRANAWLRLSNGTVISMEDFYDSLNNDKVYKRYSNMITDKQTPSTSTKKPDRWLYIKGSK